MLLETSLYHFATLTDNLLGLLGQRADSIDDHYYMGIDYHLQNNVVAMNLYLLQKRVIMFTVVIS